MVSPFSRKSTTMHLLVFQKTVLITLLVEGTVLASFFRMLHDSIPCSVVSFLRQNGGTSFHYQSKYSTVVSHHPQQHIIKTNVMINPCMSVFHTYGSGESNRNKHPTSQRCHHLLYGMESYAMLQ